MAARNRSFSAANENENPISSRKNHCPCHVAPRAQAQIVASMGGGSHGLVTCPCQLWLSVKIGHQSCTMTGGYNMD